VARVAGPPLSCGELLSAPHDPCGILSPMARQRVTLLVIAALVAVACIGVVVAFVGTGGGSSSGNEPLATASTRARQSAFKGVAQSGLRLGSPTAAATLYVFEDPQCPYCAEWSLNAVAATVREFVKTGRLNMLLQPIRIVGTDSEPGLRAVYAAARQNRAWNMLEALYERQGTENSGWITQSVIEAAAQEAGAVPGLVVDAMRSAGVAAGWRKAELQASQWGIQGTPTFILVRQLGSPTQVQPSSLDAAGFTAALRSALQ
jgi:protein-disulfide isomerase